MLNPEQPAVAPVNQSELLDILKTLSGAQKVSAETQRSAIETQKSALEAQKIANKKREKRSVTSCCLSELSFSCQYGN